MVRIENGPEYEKEMRAASEERKRKACESREILERKKAAWRFGGCIWQPMSECPFAALTDEYGLAGSILVADGKESALVTIGRRFGRPVFFKTEPEMVFRDGVMRLECGEEDPRDDLPEWWWDWELTDEFGRMTYAGGEETGKEEVGFVPTHWTFLPEFTLDS